MQKIFRLLFLISIFILSGCSHKPKKIDMPAHHVDILVVSESNISYDFDYPGSVQGVADFAVVPRVSGTLVRQLYVEGTSVKKDQVLYEIDKRPFQNDLAASKGQLAKDNTAMMEYKSIFERYERLYKINAVSRQDLETATINYKGALGLVETDKANIAQDKLNIEYCEVRAPVSGLIAQRVVSIGTMVSAYNTTLNYINSQDNLYINFSVPENDRLTLQQGVSSGKIIVPKNSKFNMDLQLANGSMLKNAGSVSFFDTRISLQNGSWNMRGDIDNKKLETKLLSGQFVHVYLSGAKFKSAIAVPQAAIFRDNQGAFVYLLSTKNIVHKQYVQTGIMTGVLWVIDSGLKSGDLVVVEGGMKIKDGDVAIADNKF